MSKELIDRDILPDTGRILEIGGGEGDFAKDFLDYARYRRENPGCYAMLDISPHLLQLQRTAVQHHSKRLDTPQVLADGLILPIAPESVDLLIANEIIADLPVIKNICPDDVEAFPEVSAREYNSSEMALLASATQQIRKYDLAMPTNGERFHLNYGAIQFLSEIHSVLRDGGAAFITEYSSEVEQTDYWVHIPGFLAPRTGMELPEEVQLDGHSEFSIKFSHIEAAARQTGFEVESGPLHEFVGLKDYNLIEFIDDAIQLEPLTLLQFRYLILRKE